MSYGEDDIKFLLTNFFETQKKLPDVHLKHLTRTTNWPEMVKEYWKEYNTEGAQEHLERSVNRVHPTAWQVSHMDKMDRWLSVVWQKRRLKTYSEWKLSRDILFHLYLRNASYRDIAYEMTFRGGLKLAESRRRSISHTTIKRIYQDLLDEICKVANKEGK